MAKGSFLVSKAAAKVLIEQGLGGDIVYISSKNSVFAGPNNIAYSATKADQAHQVRLLAAELGEHGIKVNGVNPDGVVQGSGIFASGWGANRAAVYGVEEKDLGKFYAQRTILKREVLPENIANAVFALCGPDMTHTTGLHVPVDAGVGGGVPAMSKRRRRRGRPRRHLGSGDGRRGRRRPRRARRSRRCTASPTAGSGTPTARCAGTSGGSTVRCWRASGWPPPRARSTRSASTRGASTTGCSTRPGSWSRDPYSHRDARTDGVAETVVDRDSARTGCTPRPASSSCRSTRSTS